MTAADLTPYIAGWAPAAPRTVPTPISAPPAVPPPMSGQRVTVALIPPVVSDLRQLQEHTKLSVTDLANRAITFYAFYDRQSRAGRSFLVRDPWSGELQLVWLR